MKRSEFKSCYQVATDNLYSRSKIDDSIETQVKESGLKDAGNGIFTLEDIKKGTIFGLYSTDLQLTMNDIVIYSNDPLIDLSGLKDIDDPNDFYERLKQMYANYYDPTKASEMINIKTVIVVDMNSQGRMMYCAYEAIKDIKQGEEIFKSYDFSTWISIDNNKVAREVFYPIFEKSKSLFNPFFQFIVDWLNDTDNHDNNCYGNIRDIYERVYEFNANVLSQINQDGNPSSERIKQ
jgi:hypothetical protein